MLRVDAKRYWRCPSCQLTFLDPADWLDRDAERAVYELHQNSEQDAGYRAFLWTFAKPVLQRLEPASKGLDFGCGPGPLLASMLEDAGHDVALYDPFFAADAKVLERRYDFVVATETVEHFQRPGDEFRRLNELLRPGGLLGLMTCFQTDDDAFAAWHYRRDPTHVVFYREHTMRFLAQRYGWVCDIPRKNVVLFQKQPT